MRPRVLFISHGHPTLIAGGAEQSALELYTAMRSVGGFEPFLLARTADSGIGGRSGTRFGSLGDDPNQILTFVPFLGDDHFLQTSSAKWYYTDVLSELLRTLRPDVVHFQHTSHIGMEAIRQVQATLPAAPIVMTLHEYLPICAADGQMVRTGTRELCTDASPARCHECFPQIPASRFLVRERFIKAQLGLVDLFVAPSRFLLERYVKWGLPREKLVLLDYGRARPNHVDSATRNGAPRSRLGYFGQLNPYKGILELLAAMRLLAASGRSDVTLEVSGANLELQSAAFQRDFAQQLADAGPSVEFLGPYGRTDLSVRMARVDWVVVPSIWWENSPLVIQEAFLHKRPVLCSDIGGMAEKVMHGVNGLHFGARSPQNMARVIQIAVDTAGLWDRLRAGIPEVPSVEDAAAVHALLYQELLAGVGSRPHGWTDDVEVAGRE